jgi:hypothetical protein
VDNETAQQNVTRIVEKTGATVQAEERTEILACGICLRHHDLKEKSTVGEVSNMYTVAETMLGAGKIVSL